MAASQRSVRLCTQGNCHVFESQGQVEHGVPCDLEDAPRVARRFLEVM